MAQAKEAWALFRYINTIVKLNNKVQLTKRGLVGIAYTNLSPIVNTGGKFSNKTNAQFTFPEI